MDTAPSSLRPLRVLTGLTAVPILAAVLAFSLTAAAQDAIPLSAAGVSNGTMEATNDMPMVSNGRVSTAGERADLWHENVCANLLASIDRFDRFFGDESVYEDTRETRISLAAGIYYERKDEASFESRTRVRISLPYLENRFQLLFDNDSESDEPQSLGSMMDSVADSRPTAGLRESLVRNDWVRIHADAQFRVGNVSQLLLKLRARSSLELDCWEVRFTETGKWYSEDGFSAISEVRFSRPLFLGWIGQATSSCTWEEQEEGVKLEQHLAFLNESDWRRAWRLDLHGEWPEVPHNREETYSVSVTFRQRIFRDWLFLELAPGVEFPEEDDYFWNPFVTILFDVVLAGD